jgi:hypothetical protein
VSEIIYEKGMAVLIVLMVCTYNKLGDFNSANINIKANRTEIKLNQQGYGNSIAISKKLFRYNKE